MLLPTDIVGCLSINRAYMPNHGYRQKGCLLHTQIQKLAAHSDKDDQVLGYEESNEVQAARLIES